MAFDIVRGSINNIPATEELIEAINSISEEITINGTLFLGYPLSASAETKVIADALLVSRNFGIIVFVFSNILNTESIIEQQGEYYFQLINTLTKYPSLRKGKGLSFQPNVITILPQIPKEVTFDAEYIVTTIGELKGTLSNVEVFDENYYEPLCEALHKVSTIKPKKKRDNVCIEGSKGSIIKKIDKEIANLDQWQKKAAFEVADGPQRIRGLAGSGKTIVLALKAAYLHIQNPNWDIVVTYYTRSLWQQYRDLITKFVLEFSGDDPDWNKIHLYHSWGSLSEQGVYSAIAKLNNFIPTNYANAKIKFGRENAFNGICEDLLDRLADNYQPQFDVFMIDEAQDMPASFFKLAYKSTKNPKRIIWAYDELQNLNSTSMPTISEMFGTDLNGNPLVQLAYDPSGPQQDIVLPVCYRNPPWLLALAHSLGFGLYRKPIVQFFEDLKLWEDIGYSVERGNLQYGKSVTLARRNDASPKYFFDLLSPDQVINAKTFESRGSQYLWIAQNIKKNITEDELDPDDILVIFPNAIVAKKEYYEFKKYLDQYGISSMLAGITDERDIFKISGSVSCSSIYRAKGNEAPMVYIVNSEYCFNGFELIKLRNILFTAITRSRAWMNMCGIGEDMKGIESEINKYVNKDYRLSFKIPTRDEIIKSRTIYRDRTAAESKKIEEVTKGLKSLMDLAAKDEFDMSSIPEFNVLMQYILRKQMGANNEEDE